MTTKSSLTLTALAAAALLSACGGGGGDPGGPQPVVTLSSTTTPRYGDTLLITMTGSNLDQPLSLSSSGCRNFVRSTSAPNISTATTAYYTCTVGGGSGALSVTVSAFGQVVATVPFNVPVPEVTMAIGTAAGATLGNLVITLAPNSAPLTVDNFLAYVRAGFYNNTAFHRHARFANDSTFVLQGGGYASTPALTATAAFPALKPTNAPIVLERGLSNRLLTVAMARTNQPNSATSQFFINTTDNSARLDGTGNNDGYAAFGTVTTGSTVVDQMVGAACSLSPVNFDPPPPQPASRDCLPVPNLVVTGALQTR
jgi:cyclophilin family peptidyl-prolyl cis-trans isomerase